MSAIISEIEAHARAALPALDTEFYDGWQLRFADGHTRRANSVNFVGPSSLPLKEKISHCETAYKQINQPCHFRLTPLADEELDTELSTRGYSVFDQTDVLFQPLAEAIFTPERTDIVIQENISTDGVNTIGNLTGLSATSKRIFEQMIGQSEHRLLLAVVKDGNKIVSCGLGALTDDFLGLFEFATDREYRRQGNAAAIVQGLIAEAVNCGAKAAYLQAVQSNIGGRKFWEKMGFKTRLYSYHYRSKL